jgi:hypothetical protein
MKGHLISGLLTMIVMASGAPAQTFDEYQVKAAFLFNFAKFVEWPPQAFVSASDPISICVLGPNPFGTSLEDAVAGKSLGGRKFAVRQLTDLKEAGRGCQILYFVARQKMPSPDSVWMSVLTVGESPGFAASGGTIGFKLESGRVRLEINVGAAEQRHLRISSKLLSLAEIVKTRGM